MTSAKMHEPTPIMMSPTKKPKPKLFQLKNNNYKTSHIFRWFEQLTRSAVELWLCKVQQKSGAHGTERVKA